MLVVSIIVIVTIIFSGKTSSYSWNIEVTNIDGAWNYAEGIGQTIAFLDTGLNNEILIIEADRIIYPYNVIEDSYDVKDYNGHGTEVISAACLSINSINGIAPKAKIMPIVVMDDEGNTTPENLCKGIKWAIEHNATIINLSLGGFIENENLTCIIEEAIKSGIYVVAAAGDYSSPYLLYPASLPDVISVVAQNNKGERYANSNFSESANLLFPGEKIPVINTNYKNEIVIRESCGTSIATSQVSGLIALALECNNEMQQNELNDIIKESIQNNGFIDAELMLKIIAKNAK
jgi:serine protease